MKAFDCNLFDGADDVIEIPHTPYELGTNLTNGFTISAWILARTAGEGNVGRIFDKSSGINGDTGFAFQISAGVGGVLKFRMGAGGTSRYGSAIGVFNYWFNALVTVSAAQLCTFYVNGVLNGSANQDLVGTIAGITTANNATIGCHNTGVGAFDGGIRDVKMWNKVLSADEITQEAFSGGYVARENLIHYFKLGGDYTDYGFVGVAATNTGSVVACMDGPLTTAVKAQRVASTDSWLLYRGRGGQIGSINIEQA